MGELDTDTALEAAGEGIFATTVSDRWNGLVGGPLGGYLIAICLRALGVVMPFADPVVLSAFFLRPGEVGPAEVQTELIRAGRTVASGQARLVQGGKERMRLTATFTDLRQTRGHTLHMNAPPELPTPEQAVDPFEVSRAAR